MAPKVSYELPDPALEQYTWVWQNEHAPGSQPPLTRDMFRSMFPEDPGQTPRNVRIHGYNYARFDPDGPGFQAPPAPEDGLTALQRWEQKWLPRVNREFEMLMGFDPSAVERGNWAELLEEQAQSFGRVFGGVHMQCVLPSDKAANAFIDAYVAAFGQERHADALALMQGFPNQTLERAQEIWALSRLAREDADLRRRLADPALDINAADAGLGEFGRRFHAFLERWGDTMDMFVQDLPSWRENWRVPLDLILQEARRPDADSPAAASATQARRRKALEQELRERATDKAVAALLDQLAEAQEMLPVRENHNFLCDQRLSAASRARWLAIGRFLTAQGALPRADDVFYLRAEELIAALETGAAVGADELAERRAFQAAVRATPPPATLGKPREAADAGAVQVEGVAASSGRFTGTARVTRSIDEAVRLTPDDVLVCVVTAPAWTPIFGVVGAVVTDAGNFLSHPSIVAREYGLPAVVGTGNATETIPNGATITVDGDAGTVTIESG